MSNATYDLGRVGLNLRGEYSPTAAYERLDVVSWHNGSYVAKTATAGVSPDNADKWQALAKGTAPYTTSEIFTGQYWLDGKPIYSKTLLVGAKIKNTQTIATDVPDLYQMLDIRGMMYAGTDYSGYAFVAPAAKTNVDWQIGLEYDKDANMVIIDTTLRTYACGFITISYTKTSD